MCVDKFGLGATPSESQDWIWSWLLCSQLWGHWAVTSILSGGRVTNKTNPSMQGLQS